MKTDFFKERYDFELTLREELSNRVSTPLTVTTALGGAFVFFIHNYPFSEGWQSVLFFVILAAFAVSLLVAVFSIFQANVGYRYKAVADGSELMRAYKDLLEHYGNDETKADGEFNRQLCERYSAATEVNARNNARKVKAVARANAALACAAAIAVIAAGPYFGSLSSKKDKPLKVEIVK